VAILAMLPHHFFPLADFAGRAAASRGI